MSTPLPFTWDGESMVPRRGFARQCDAQFVIGETYRMEVVEDRSAATHRHYFAAVNEAWQNLPERLAGDYPSPEHLRKRALIKAGFADSHQIVASSKAEALRIAAFIRPLDEYAVVTVNGAVVTRFTAQSQSIKAMGKERFQASKTAVLELVAELVGVTPAELMKQGEAA